MSAALDLLADFRFHEGLDPILNIIWQHADTFDPNWDIRDWIRKHASTALPSSVAQAQAASGDLAGARATLAEIVDPEDRARVLAAIAQTQAANGDIDGARATLAEIADPGKQSEALANSIKVALTSAQFEVTAQILITAAHLEQSAFVAIAQIAEVHPESAVDIARLVINAA